MNGCAGTSTKAHWAGGRRPAGACKRPVAFVVRDADELRAPVPTCLAHLGGLVARMVADYTAVVVERPAS